MTLRIQQRQNTPQYVEKSHNHSWEQSGSTVSSVRQKVGQRWGSTCKDSRAFMSAASFLGTETPSRAQLHSVMRQMSSFPTQQPCTSLLSFPNHITCQHSISGKTELRFEFNDCSSNGNTKKTGAIGGTFC